MTGLQPAGSQPRALAPASDPQATRRWRALLIALGILAAAVLANLPALWAGFIWDDAPHLLDHPVLKPGGLWHVWFKPDYGMYWPVTFTTNWLEFHLFGLHPHVFHTTNILIHGINSALVWRIARRLDVPWPWMVGLLFAVHPVNVESVAWVAQRKGLMCMLMACLSVLAHLRFIESHKPRHQLTSAAFYWLSMLSKGASVSLPGVLLVLTWYRRGKVTPRDLLALWPFVVVTAIMSASEYINHVQGMVGDDPVRPEGLLQVATGFGWIVWFYIYKAMLPIQLSIVYPRWSFDPTIPLHHVPNLMLAAVLVLAWLKRDTRWGRSLLVALGLFVLLVLPAAGFIKFYFLMFSWVGDHYQYLALPALLSLVVAAVHELWRRLNVPLPAMSLAGAALVLLLGSMSFARARLYCNPEAMWLDTLSKNPGSWVSWNNLGSYYLDQYRFKDAERIFTQLFSMPVPTSRPIALAHFNYALSLSEQGRPLEAEPLLRKALECNPKLTEARGLLALVLTRLKRFPEAEAEYRTLFSFDLEPAARARDLLNHAGLLMQMKQDNQAEQVLRQVLQLAPASHGNHARSYLIQIYAERGQLEQAELTLRELEQANPSTTQLAMGHHNLGIAYAQRKLHEPALAHLHRATQVSPEMVQSRIALGILLKDAGRFEEAAAVLQQALVTTREPSLRAKIAVNLSRVLEMCGQAEESLQVLERATLENANSPELALRTAQKAVEQKKPERARAILQEALQANPEHSGLKAMLVQIK